MLLNLLAMTEVGELALKLLLVKHDKVLRLDVPVALVLFLHACEQFNEAVCEMLEQMKREPVVLLFLALFDEIPDGHLSEFH